MTPQYTIRSLQHVTYKELMCFAYTILDKSLGKALARRIFNNFYTHLKTNRSLEKSNEQNYYLFLINSFVT